MIHFPSTAIGGRGHRTNFTHTLRDAYRLRMGTKPRRFVVFITAFVAAGGLAAYFVMASNNSSRENPRPLVVSSATLEDGQMLVTIAKIDFPRTTFKKLSFAN